MRIPRNRTVPLIVAAALFMEHLDSTIIATALPVMAKDFGLPPIMLNLAITTYLVAVAVFIPASGWLADRFGARRVFVSAIGVFLLGSILCGLSQSLPMLVGGRLVQGLGGAMMVPVGRLLLLRSVPKTELISAMAWLTIPAMIGPVMGPPVGGFITTYASWRWLFWINVPIGIIGIAVALWLLPSIREEDAPAFDYTGFFLSAAGLAAGVFAFETLGRGIVPVEVTVAAALVGFTLIFAYIRHARNVDRPLVDLSLLRIPTFRAAVVGGSLFRIGVGAVPFLLPLQLQIGFGRSPLESGLTTFVSAAGALMLKAFAGRIIGRFGFRNTLVFNSILGALFIAVVGLAGPGTPVAILMSVLLIGGFFRSLEFTAINAIGYADIEPAQMSRATSLSGMAQQLSLSGGVAFAALTLHLLTMKDGLALDAGHISIAIGLVGILSASAAWIFAALPENAGEAMIGKFSSESRGAG
jgi:EmrB/QacA subfamily drug resistance transporter